MDWITLRRNVVNMVEEIAAQDGETRQGLIEAIRGVRDHEWFVMHNPGALLLQDSVNTILNDLEGLLEKSEKYDRIVRIFNEHLGS